MSPAAVPLATVPVRVAFFSPDSESLPAVRVPCIHASPVLPSQRYATALPSLTAMAMVAPPPVTLPAYVSWVPTATGGTADADGATVVAAVVVMAAAAGLPISALLLDFLVTL